MRHAFQSKKHSWWSVSLSTTIYRLRGTNRQNGFYPIFSALIREITRHILYLFHSQNYQLHADSKGTLIMVRDRMPDLRAVSILTFSTITRNVSKKKRPWSSIVEYTVSNNASTHESSVHISFDKKKRKFRFRINSEFIAILACD